MTQPDSSIPGARLLLDQMVRLSDNLLVSVDHLQQKSRAYLSVGALAVAAGVAFLTVPATIAEAEAAFRIGVIGGASLRTASLRPLSSLRRAGRASDTAA